MRRLKLVDLFSFTYPSACTLTQILDCQHTWVSSTHYESTGEESNLWTFQLTWYHDLIDCSDSMMDVLVVGTIADIKEPQKGKTTPSFSILYLNPALEHVADHSLTLFSPRYTVYPVLYRNQFPGPVNQKFQQYGIVSIE